VGRGGKKKRVIETEGSREERVKQKGVERGELTKIPVRRGGKIKRVIETEGRREGRVNQDTHGKRWKKEESHRNRRE